MPSNRVSSSGFFGGLFGSLLLSLLAWAPPASADRLGSWDKPAGKFLDPVTEPDKRASYFVMENGSELWDFLLADELFIGKLTKELYKKDTVISKWGALLFVIDSCASGGFIGDLATTDGKESSLKDPKKIRPLIGVMTACAYNLCSVSGGSGNGKDDFSAFSRGVDHAFAMTQPAHDDSWLAAFQSGSRVVQQALEIKKEKLQDQAPQYWSTSRLIDEDTLRPPQGTQNYAFLVVEPKDKNEDKELAFWHDLVRLHGILVKDYGWSDQNDSKKRIITLFADGKPPASVKNKIDWITGPASDQALIDVLAEVHGNFTNSSIGFFYFAGHGASKPNPQGE